jgi:glycosyltransferase involved in cell wall biosynthesis
MSEHADATLILEGTYPYVAGGVSTWVHQLLHAYPSRRFGLLHISPHPGAYSKRAFELPENVVELRDVYCRGAAKPRLRRTSTGQPRLQPRRERSSRVLAGIRRMHLEDRVDDEMLADLSSGDLSLTDLLHGEEAFELVRNDLYPRLSPDAPFMDFFWHFRGMHIPLLRLLSAPCPEASMYHAVSAGYAGLLGAVASWRTGRPLAITEHGIYAREREIELARASWIKDVGGREMARPSPLRRFWHHFFQMLSRIAYHRATHVITLSEANRTRQLADGADPAKTYVVPNGVDRERFRAPANGRQGRRDQPMKVGFVGRVVPIKDVITLIRACSLAADQVELELWIVGPEDEDSSYAQRCHALVESIGLEEHVRFMGSQPMTEIYPQLDVLVLTSISEGQPLVILEAHAAGLPVVSTDVGACRELIEGGDEHDRSLGASGIVTRVANPIETAAALVFLARHPEVRERMGRSGLARVTARYQQQQVVARYDSLYAGMVLS